MNEFDTTQETPEIIQETEQVVEQQQEQKESERERNFKALREKAARLERERDEALRIAQELQHKSQEPADDDSDFNIGEEDIAEGKHLKKLHNEIRTLKKTLQQQQQVSSESLAETRLRAQYPNYEKILTTDNIAALREQAPELAEAIGATQDIYKKAAATISAIKRLGIGTEDVYEQERAIAQKNAQKPKPVAALAPQQGDSPLSKANAFANGLTDELRAQLHREMVEAMRAR